MGDLWGQTLAGWNLWGPLRRLKFQGSVDNTMDCVQWNDTYVRHAADHHAGAQERIEPAMERLVDGLSRQGVRRVFGVG